MLSNCSVGCTRSLTLDSSSFLAKTFWRQYRGYSNEAAKRFFPLRTTEELHAKAKSFIEQGGNWLEFQKHAHLSRRPLEERAELANLFGKQYRPYKQRIRLNKKAYLPKTEKPNVQAEGFDFLEARETRPIRSEAQETEALSHEQAREQSEIARVLTLLEEMASNLRELVKQGSFLKPSSRVGHLDVNTTQPALLDSSSLEPAQRDAI